MIQKIRTLLTRKGQGASELAIFGAVLIFIVGLIVRYATNFNAIQNQWLKAMRLAMKMSHIHSYDAGGMGSSRNTASVLFIEDRKDIDVAGLSGKVGTENRIPYVFGGSGTFTKNLLMAPSFGAGVEVPVMDVFINGRHFALSMAAYKNYCVAQNAADCDDPAKWVPTTKGEVNAEGNFVPYFFKKVSNIDKCFVVNATDDFDVIAHPGTCDHQVHAAFDLNRNGKCDNQQSGLLDYGKDYTEPCRPGAHDPRLDFSWQWQRVLATPEEIDIKEGQTINYDVDGDLKEESVFGLSNAAGEDLNDYLQTRAQTILKAAKECQGDPGTVTYVNVLDFQEGDIDPTYNTYDAWGGATPASGDAPRSPAPPRPGLTNDTSIYTRTLDGTLLEVEEGKLYLPNTKQYVRQTQKRDRVAVIQRTIQLSNDTGRLCKEYPTGSGVYKPNLSTNPDVEVCVDNEAECFSAENVEKVCFARDTLKLFVRSRIKDKTGRRWVTDISDDEMPIK